MSKVVLITGASSGIGQILAEMLHRSGYQVFGTSRTPSTTQAGAFEMLTLDVTDTESVRACVAELVQRAGRVDILINNAGYDLYAAGQDTEFSDYVAQMETNFWGAVWMSQAILPMMQMQGNGRIINMSSLGGRLALPFNSAYSASKFALEGYSESLRLELLASNIFITLIEAGQVKTDSLERSLRSTKHGQSAQVLERMRTMAQAASLTPQAVAAVTVQVIAARRPALRYVVGSQARITLGLHRWLPTRLFEALLVRQFVTPIINQTRQTLPSHKVNP